MQRAPARPPVAAIIVAPHAEQVVWSVDVIGDRRPNDPVTRPAGRVYCSQNAMAGFVVRLALRRGILIFVFCFVRSTIARTFETVNMVLEHNAAVHWRMVRPRYGPFRRPARARSRSWCNRINDRAANSVSRYSPSS